MNTQRFQHTLTSATLALLFTVAGGWSGASRADTVDLARTPPNVTRSVDPNIVVTFDDSGSMASDYMGDDRPFDNGSWGGRWKCAGVIDPRVTDKTDLRSHAMNGVYYNPNITYVPPVLADGTSMPNADKTLKKVWTDGIYQNRPRNSGTSGTRNFFGSYNDTTYWYCGQGKEDPISGGGPYYWRLKAGVDIGTLAAPDTGELYDYNNWEAVAVPTTQYQNWANWYAYYRTRNLMTRTALSRVFGQMGGPAGDGGYGSGVRVAWQNINDGDFKLPGSAIISSLLDLTSDGTTSGAKCDASGIDPETVQRSGAVTAPPQCYRSAMFNWIFDTGASGGTPDRASTIRAGKFFQRSLSETLQDPYWNGRTDAQSSDLSCRQNFHMLVTDGYWNEGDPSLPSTYFDSETTYTTLPAGSTTVEAMGYSPSASESLIFGNVSGTKYKSSLANIAFNYWAQDLQPDLGNNVPPFITDKTTGVTGSAPLNVGDDPLQNTEIFWNPVNDPANWQHVVQFMVTLGIAGKRNFPDDLLDLRKGTLDWPRPVNNAPEAVDDTWHAAINSRGSYFSAANPSELVTHLVDIINSIAARGASSTQGGLSSSVLTSDAKSYGGSYQSDDWSGSVVSRDVSAEGKIDTVGIPNWDAGCLLTGGACKSMHGPVAQALTPNARKILTSTDGTVDSGVPFRWADLGAINQAALNANASGTDGAGVDDNLGQKRLDYLRGDRTLESGSPQMRRRGSLLGAVINSQVAFVAYPGSGYRDDFPDGSPEAVAVASSSHATYSSFAAAHANREHMLYVGANDGMLHAFDAKTGEEKFAYVPHLIYWSQLPTSTAAPVDVTTGKPQLSRLTETDYNFTPTVDATPVTRDVFYDGGWHTLLVGGLRLGGRGVYALDITNPATISEGTAKDAVLWEFPNDTNRADAANLGYTYGTPNIGRLPNGKWVVLVPGGYFPDCSKFGTLIPCDGNVSAANNTFSSLFVLDAQTGALLKELKTSAANTGGSVKSYGLGSVVLGDYQDDQIDDVAFAGDLMGNVWRFDLSDANASNWSVDLVFQGKVDSDGKPTQSITTMPRLFPDATSGRFMVVFGTGKYLGLSDRKLNSAGTQAIYGIREQGASTRAKFPAGYYPVKATDSALVEQDLSDAGSGLRLLTKNEVPYVNAANQLVPGWFFNLDVPVGERVVVPATALFSVNLAVFATLQPGQENDPCDPSTLGSLLVIDALTGGPSDGLKSLADDLGITVPDDKGVAGKVTKNVPTSGNSVPTLTPPGGGTVVIPGLPDLPALDIQPIYHRGAWRVLKDNT
ncbi:MAG TPA: PilC/PilY family type IV pilus protein [Rhodanobacteraceae bacterium]|nr:PilC/PilY family type IV pilus protein [Rhodanobacteraceae bacterium]